MNKKVKRKIAVLAAMLSIGQARSLAMDSYELQTKTQSNSQLTKDLAIGAVTILGGALLIWGGVALAKYLKNKKPAEPSITTVIDLRYPEELKREPDKFSGESDVNYKNITIPVSYSSFGNMLHMFNIYLKALGCFNPTEPNGSQFKHVRKNIKEIFETIASAPEDGKILFHCSHGKDRTGILSMLILSLAGVSKEDIVKNFLECYNEDGKSKVQPFTKEAFEQFIDFLIEHYGDMEKFLKDECSVSDETIKKVKKRIISS